MPAEQLLAQRSFPVRELPSQQKVIAQVLRSLLGLGASLGALQAGLDEYPVERPCPVGNAYEVVQHEYSQGQPLKKNGRVVMALFFNCCMYNHPADNLEVSRKFGTKHHCFASVLMHNQDMLVDLTA